MTWGEKMNARPAKTKTCTKCGETKRLSAFARHKSYKCGYRAQCKKCLNTMARASLARRSTAEKGTIHRRYNLKRLYGITVEEYDAMLSASEGGCWICGYHPKPGGRRLSVDHDHKNKKTRGLLCHMCNRGLAHFRDKPDRLRAAAKYLEG